MGQMRLTREDMQNVSRLGFCEPGKKFCDAKNDGVVRISNQSSSYARLDGYREAFDVLAGLGGKKDAIDRTDIASLNEPPILGLLLSRDPAYRILAKRQTALEMGTRELRSAGAGDPIPPRHFRRLMTYAQKALGRVLNMTIVADGDYGEQTRELASVFQRRVLKEVYAQRRVAMGKMNKKFRVADDAQLDGKRIGIDTVGLLIMRCRYSKVALLEQLHSDRKMLQDHGAFIMGEAMGKNATSIQRDVCDALKWLGYLDERVDTGSVYGLNAAAIALQDFFGQGVTLVGPQVLDWIVGRVKAFEL